MAHWNVLPQKIEVVAQAKSQELNFAYVILITGTPLKIPTYHHNHKFLGGNEEDLSFFLHSIQLISMESPKDSAIGSLSIYYNVNLYRLFIYPSTRSFFDSFIKKSQKTWIRSTQGPQQMKRSSYLIVYLFFRYISLFKTKNFMALRAASGSCSLVSECNGQLNIF